MRRRRKPTIERLEPRRLFASEILKEFDPGPSSYVYPFGYTSTGEKAFFFVESADPTGDYGIGLYVTNGTPGTTVRVADASPDVNSLNRDAIGDTFFYEGRDAHGHRQLYRSDGTSAGTFAVTDGGDINFDISWTNYSRVRTLSNSKVVFTAKSGGFNKLFVTDGTVAGTSLLKDLFPGQHYEPDWFRAAGDEMFFAAADPTTHHTQLWKTDGTTNGTQLVQDFTATLLEDFVASGSTLYFVSANANGWSWWRSDGTTTGTYQLTNPADFPGFTPPESYASAGNDLYFAAYNNTYGTRLWKSNGTVSGTVSVDPSPSGAASSISSITAWQDGVLYFQTTGSDGELWKYQPNMAAPQVVADNVGSTWIVSADDVAYFVNYDDLHGTELWQTDGTAAGTHIVADDTPGPVGSYLDLWGDVAIGRSLLYSGPAGDSDVSQPRIAPVTEVSSIAFQSDASRQQVVVDFADPVDPATFTPTDISLSSSGPSAITIPTAQLSIAWNTGHTEATVTYTGSASGALPDGNWAFSVGAESFSNTFGVPNFSPASATFFTFGGDANQDGVVNVADLFAVAKNWQTSGKTFADGDFDYNGTVDLADLKILAANWGKTVNGLSAAPQLGPMLAALALPVAADPASSEAEQSATDTEGTSDPVITPTSTIPASKPVSKKPGVSHTSAISGSVFNDRNRDGKRKGRDAGLAGWRVFIDSNNDGILDDGEASVLTDTKGNWTFKGLSAGTYTVRVASKPYWTGTTAKNEALTIKLKSGEKVTHKSFGQAHQA